MDDFHEAFSERADAITDDAGVVDHLRVYEQIDKMLEVPNCGDRADTTT